MRAAPLATALFLVAIVPPAFAQTPECASYTGNSERVCAAAVDGTRALHPVAGVLVSGGNPTIGSAATLGGIGHFSLSARANAVQVVLPDLNYNGSGSTVPAGDKIFTPAPQVEGALGLYRGMPTGLLAVDFLGSAQLLPTDQIHNLTVDAGARKLGGIALGLGYGARVGIFNGLGILPALSVSVMRRDLPTITYGDVPAGDRYSYGVDLHATNLRLIASKHVAVLDMAFGMGLDKYTGNALIQFRDPITSAVQPPVPVALNTSRVLSFVNAGLSMSVVKLTGELGYQGGRDQHLSTTFDGFDTTVGKFFAGLGLRVGF
ncbi:MAG TPA: hypothetical protein VGN76_07940 [Gemmatimonadales bacterium]|jgi:hypothetical protein|nr:hypothetical protein [Gemmatimonadales bacterium]